MSLPEKQEASLKAMPSGPERQPLRAPQPPARKTSTSPPKAPPLPPKGKELTKSGAATLQKSVSPQDYYQRLKAASPIGDVARDLFAGRITNSNATTLFIDCLHHESQSKASLQVSLELGLWNCFGCRVGGDVIQLSEFADTGRISKCTKGNLTPEHRAARDFLAERAGMPPLASGQSEQDEQAYAETRDVRAASSDVCQIFHARLVASENAKVVDWIMEKYGFTRETIDKYKMGWSGGTCVFSEVVALGHDPEIVKATGFFRLGTFPTDIYSFYKDRIVFSYWAGGQVVYAIGRKTPWTEDTKFQKAKYMKLGVYDEKKRSYVSRCVVNPALFGEDILSAKPEAVILAEGIVDAIAAQQVGFPAVSPATIQLMKDEAERVSKALANIPMVYIVPDNELSGVGLAGAMKTAEIFEQHGVTCKIVVIPLNETCEQACAEFEQLIGAEQFRTFMDAKGARKSAVLKECLADRPEVVDHAKSLMGAAKIDLCDYLRDNPGLESLKALLKLGVKPIEILIEGTEKKDDPDEQLLTLKPLLARIWKTKAPFQGEFLKKLKAHLGLSWNMNELKAIGKDAANKAAELKVASSAGNSVVIESNDNHLGDEFVVEHGGVIRFAEQGGGWAIWDKKRWKWDRDKSIEALARTTTERIGRIAEDRAALAAKNKDRADARRLGAFAQRCLSMAGVRAALDVAMGTGAVEGSRICLSLESFDSYQSTRNLLNCENGVLDLHGEKLIPHEDAKELYVTKLAPVAYRPEAKCPMFLIALSQIFEADIDSDRAARLIELVQIAIGYSMLGDQSHHLLFLLYGPKGRNGKSVLIQIFQAILGPDYATTAAPGLLKQKKGECHPTELADLIGRRFVSTVEMGRNESLNEALVKQLTGGDSIKARRMHEDFGEFQPTHHLWILTNALPKADAFDPAFWTRFRTIPFERQFLKPGDAGYDADDPICHADDSLVDRLLANESEGIFAWMVEGCRKYLEAGAVPNPPESQQATAEYRQQNDPIGEWIEEMCDVTGTREADRKALPDDWWSASWELYACYCAWVAARGEKAAKKSALGRALSYKGFPSGKGGPNRGRGRRGIRIKECMRSQSPHVSDGGAQ